MSDDERTIFRRLAVFAAGFTFDAAVTICSRAPFAPAGAENLILSLVRKSLVNRVSADLPRYALLETIREYAAEKLAEAGEADEYRNRHSDYFLDFAERAEPKIKSAERPVWARRYHEEHENIQAARA